MGNHIDFKEIQNRVNLYLDNAYNEEQTQDFLNHVNTDPQWGEILSKERKNRDLLKTHITRPSVTSDLVKNIRDNINLH